MSCVLLCYFAKIVSLVILKPISLTYNSLFQDFSSPNNVSPKILEAVESGSESRMSTSINVSLSADVKSNPSDENIIVSLKIIIPFRNLHHTLVHHTLVFFSRFSSITKFIVFSFATWKNTVYLTSIIDNFKP